MKTYKQWMLAVLALVTLLISGCGAMSPQATEAPAERPRAYQLEAEYATAAPTASPPGDAFGPSTGGTDEPNDQPYGDVFFNNYGVNPRIDTEDDHFSTFAVDVDTASYTVMRSYVNDGYLPDKDSVRVEEYVNFFEPGYAPPSDDTFAIYADGAPSPYAENYHLVRVGLKGYEIPEEARRDVVLTFVIDVSGSMGRGNRLGLVKEALGLLVAQLRPTDEIGIVVYGNNARVVLEHTPVEEAAIIHNAIRRLQTEGATNAEAGLRTAYRLAQKNFNPEATNRVILCSDGVANVGRTGHKSIWEQVEDYAEDGIYLTTIGVGMGNYNDELMEQLADNGDGFYAYVDDIKEAERVFVHKLPSSLQVIARDAKVQVDFDPAVVSRYRLIGYENRDVADEDFRNDEVDAGEIGPGHSVTALYEVKFDNDADAEATAMTVYVRWQDPDTSEVVEMSRGFAQAELDTAFEGCDPRYQLTALVAQYAEVLRESYWAKDAGTTLEEIALEARRVAELLPRDEDVQEFARLSWNAVNLSPTR